MFIDFGRKLKLTARVLGCPTQKDLYARFKGVNPATTFNLTASYKWIQGRATPRSTALLEDWRALLNVGKSGGYLASCTFAEFVDLVAKVHDVPEDVLRERQEGTPASPRAEIPPPGPRTRGDLLAGTYAAYSMAWWKAMAGRIIRGSFQVEPQGDGLGVVYEENNRGRIYRTTGALQVNGGALHVVLADGGTLLIMCFRMPAPPGNLVVGVQCGVPLYDVEGRPTAGRIVLVRNHAASPEAHVAANRYTAPGMGEIARDLRRMGYGAGNQEDVDERIVRLLSARTDDPVLDVSVADIATLGNALDLLLGTDDLSAARA